MHKQKLNTRKTENPSLLSLVSQQTGLHIKPALPNLATTAYINRFVYYENILIMIHLAASHKIVLNAFMQNQ